MDFGIETRTMPVQIILRCIIQLYVKNDVWITKLIFEFEFLDYQNMFRLSYLNNFYIHLQLDRCMLLKLRVD